MKKVKEKENLYKKLVNRLSTEKQFVVDLFVKSNLKFGNTFKMAVAVRKTRLAGVRNFRFSWDDEFYKLPEDERVNLFVKYVDKVIINKDDSKFRPMTKEDLRHF
jgi:hypothetical protein